MRWTFSPVVYCCIGFQPLPFLFAGTVFAASTTPDLASSFYRVIWGLLIVLGLILILYGITKKRFSLLSTSNKKEISIVEIKPLMGKKALCLVEVRGEEFLLGISGDSISHLATLKTKTPSAFKNTLESIQDGTRDE
jgi:flagellar protein FliO/FliZ